MPARSLPLFLLGLLLALAPARSHAQAPPMRVMPLGDSITYGASIAGGYRARLYQLLTTAGYNVDYVGNVTLNGVAGLPDSDHEGHSGYRIDQIDTDLANYLAPIADPDVVLLHIGTNDFGQNFSTPAAIDRLDALLTKITAAKPYAHVIVTNLMERTPAATDTKIQAEFNPFVQNRVNAQAALGRRVTFLDMRAGVPLAEMADGLHPNQIGYNHMADTWLPAIQAVISPNGDFVAPQIVSVRGVDFTHLAITFSKPMSEAVTAAENFAIDQGVNVLSAQLDSSKRILTLTTSPQARRTTYQLTLNQMVDRLATSPMAVPNGTVVNFFSATPRGYLNNVPESAGYTLAYTLDVPATANYLTSAPAYSRDNHLGIGSFSRVAYYVELQSAGGDLQYAWASMDAFTSDVTKIGVPTLASGAVFQQAVTDLHIFSNVDGLATGTVSSGNLEFWPNDYTPANGGSVPGASTTAFDFGDTRSETGNYGSMQLHNAIAGQTVLAFNNWGGNATAGNVDLGLGNRAADTTRLDWTGAKNGAAYTVKTIQVLVLAATDNTPPVITSVTAGFDNRSVVVSFSEPLNPATVQALNFTLSGGVYVIGATLAPNQRDVILLTTTLPVGPVTVTAQGLRDNSPSANLLVGGVPVPVAAAALPPEIVSRIGAAATGYQLLYSLDLPVKGDLIARGNAAYTVDNRNLSAPFTRVAYYLELQKPSGEIQYVWTAMDAFTFSRAKLGVPTPAAAITFQRNVSNLDVISNVAGLPYGTNLPGGNLEFWATDYTAPNGTAVPNASATTFDIGDTKSATGSFGSMQVHDHDSGKTIFAINHFGADGFPLDVGIGSQPTGSPDWTNAANAGTFTRRTLHVLVLPGATVPADVLARVPESAGYQLAASINIPATGNFQSGSGFKAYDVDNRATLSPFTRIAYYLELHKPSDASPSYVWTSMDAFTTDPTRVAIPTNFLFQQRVTNLNVVSNVAGIVTGSNLATGNIEFWPSNYTGANALAIPGADAVRLDFGDGGASTTAGYGSMQVHNYGAGQTIWALNHWGTAANATNKLCLGIGNDPAPVNNGVDWTFHENAADYDTRLLHVFVLPGATDFAGPQIASTKGSTTRDRLVVSFNEPVADGAAVPANFALNGGLTVTGATLLSGNREVALTTTPQTAGQTYQLTVNGVRDRSEAANAIAANTTATFTAFTSPAVLANVPETSGYQLVYQLAIPSASGKWNLNAVPYSIDESRYGERAFDRVAYLLELDSKWAYASFDAHVTSVGKVGLPTPTVTTTGFQQSVTHLNVASNVSGVTTGTDLSGGNIEFWNGNYSAGRRLGFSNASDTLYDFDDTLSAGAYACLQVHNHDAAQTILAYNDWGSNTATSDVGIGNNPTAGAAGTGGVQQPDWTFTAFASTYTTRNLYVLVRPAPATPNGAPPEFLSHPTSRTVPPGGGTTLAVTLNGPGPFTYQWRYQGLPITGATKPWLELANLTASRSGAYDVLVTSDGGVVSTSRPATVVIPNRPPTFGGLLITTTRNRPFSVPFAQILGKAADLDPDTLSVSTFAPTSQQGGTVAVGAAQLTFSPAADFVGTDAFSVSVADGQGGTGTGDIQVRVTSATLAPHEVGSLAVRPDAKLDLLFRGQARQVYLIQRSTDLVHWTTIQTVTAGDDGLFPATDAAPPADQAFYRSVLP